MTPAARKALASEMLATLRANRFHLFREAELVALDIPYALRRKTQSKVLRLRADLPFNPKHMPIMTGPAKQYLDTVELARRESLFAMNQLKKLTPAYDAAIKKGELITLSEPIHPNAQGDVFERISFHRGRIDAWHYSCQKAWAVLTWEESQWFGDIPSLTRWAFDFPLIAPAPQRFYPLEETPERLRQMDLLAWVIEDCEAQP